MKPTSKLSAFLIIICIASSSVTANANQPNCLATAPAEPTTTTNAQGTTGISANTSQESTNINSNADPEFIEGRTTSLIGIAGRLQGDMVIGSGLKFATSTLLIDFYGPYSDLSGHLRVTETNVQGGELDESLTSVSKTGNNWNSMPNGWRRPRSHS
jgi:hypothetical protein